MMKCEYPLMDLKLRLELTLHVADLAVATLLVFLFLWGVARRLRGAPVNAIAIWSRNIAILTSLAGIASAFYIASVVTSELGLNPVSPARMSWGLLWVSSSCRLIAYSCGIGLLGAVNIIAFSGNQTKRSPNQQIQPIAGKPGSG